MKRQDWLKLSLTFHFMETGQVGFLDAFEVRQKNVLYISVLVTQNIERKRKEKEEEAERERLLSIIRRQSSNVSCPSSSSPKLSAAHHPSSSYLSVTAPYQGFFCFFLF